MGRAHTFSSLILDCARFSSLAMTEVILFEYQFYIQHQTTNQLTQPATTDYLSPSAHPHPCGDCHFSSSSQPIHQPYHLPSHPETSNSTSTRFHYQPHYLNFPPSLTPP